MLRRIVASILQFLTDTVTPVLMHEAALKVKLLKPGPKIRLIKNPDKIWNHMENN